MTLQDTAGRLVKDADTLPAFIHRALRGDPARRIVMVVGNRIVGDSRVLKSAVALADHGFEVLLVGTRPLTEEYAFGFIEGLPFLMADSTELKTGADADGHAEVMLAIGQRIARALAGTRFSVLYTHDFWGLDHGLRLMQAFAYRQALYWVHDVHEYIKGYEGILPAGRLAYAIGAETRHLGLPDQLVFVNERIADLLCAELPVQGGRRLIVHNAPRRQVTSGFRLRQAAGLAPDVPLGVYLGRATKARGLDVVVSALKALPRLHFALLSSAAQDYLAELRRLAADAGVAERLHIFPYVPDVEVASAVAEADFGISPLTRYGNSDLAVPTKVLEFIHARLPMVVSDALFQADFVQQHGLGEVFSTQDPASFVKAVERILQGAYNPDWAALQQAYSWDRQFGRVVQHLEDHASNGRVPSRGVFQGPAPSAGQPGILARGLRRIGVAAQSVNLSVNRGFAFPGDVVWPAPTIGYAQPSLAVWAARRFDLFHLHFRPIISNFAGNGYEPTSFQDLGLIRQHGHRIVFQFRGSEIRINQIYRATNPFAWDEESDPSKMPDALKLTLLDTVRECADLILVPDPELQTYVPEARIVQRAVELEHLPYVGPRRQTRPRICHAPTRRDAKGTDAVLAAVQALQAEGVELDFVLLEGLPHDELMQALAEADIVVDQIVIGWYGVLAVEAMALGKAVVAYIRDDLVSELPGGVLVNASPATITERLRELVLDAGLRARLGVAARRFVEQYHASEVVARTLDGIYSELRQAPPREGSIGMFAKAFDNTLLLMAHDKRVADAKAKAKADAKAAAAKAPAAAAPAAKAAPAKPAPTPAAAKPAATPAAAKPPRTLWYRIQHASLAKLIHRIQRLTGRA